MKIWNFLKPRPNNDIGRFPRSPSQKPHARARARVTAPRLCSPELPSALAPLHRGKPLDTKPFGV